MTQKPRYTRILPLAGLVAGLLVSSTVAWADIYKCRDDQGRISLQQVPCATAEAPVIKERDPHREAQESAEAYRKFLAEAAEREAANKRILQEARMLKLKDELNGIEACQKLVQVVGAREGWSSKRVEAEQAACNLLPAMINRR